VPLDLREPVRLLAGLQDQTVNAGGTVRFSVAPEGTGPFTYRWTVNGVALAGASDATIQFSDVNAAQSGEYAVEVSTAIGSMTSRARLAVLAGPVVIISPQSQVVRVGGTVRLNVSASGAALLSYQWQLNGVDIPGASAPVLTLDSLQLDQTGPYRVVVSNPVGSVASAPATVIVQQLVRIVSHPQETGVCENGVAVFTAGAQGSGPFTYQWSYNGVDLPGATNASLVLANVQINQAGHYQALVSNGVSSARSRSASLTVAGGEILRLAFEGRRADQSIQLLMSGPVGRNVYLQGSSDLVHWTILTNFTFTANCYEYVDLEAGASERRFYKIAPPPLRITNIARAGTGQFVLEVDGQAGLNCLIRVSEDLITWTNLTTVAIQDGKLAFTDSQSPSSTHRFYQAAPLP
jgi:hypothetical protein